jgi:uncharacterized DUF497 family protein
MESDTRYTEFFWDDANRDKNKKKHNVQWNECEEIFFNQPLIILEDPKHSLLEIRSAAFGKTDQGRLLTVVYTKRDALLRIISARDMSRKERKFYHDKENS